MRKLRLGRTGLMVTKTAMGCLPIQRCTEAEAVDILRRAHAAGINFFDTANAYTDSERKIGLALSDVRGELVIATKSAGTDARTVTEHIHRSLDRMRTDYIDLFQFHQVKELPDTEDPDSPWAAAQEAKKQGLIRHIGVTSHRLELAFELVETGLFETLQFPLSYLSGEREEALVRRCAELDVGYIAMKALAGGLITNARAAWAYMEGFPGVVPIWGVQTPAQLEEFVALEAERPALDDALRAVIEADRRELSGSFCRGCGYCQPCPEGIEIMNAARMDMLLRRSPWQQYMTDEWYEKMHRIENCRHCGACSARCPYGHDVPALLAYMLEDYDAFYASHRALV